jgi:hypothetical protein
MSPLGHLYPGDLGLTVLFPCGMLLHSQNLERFVDKSSKH